MATAFVLVQAYVSVNGYFTIAEYPRIEAFEHESARTATDVDILAFRFPGAGCEVTGVERYNRSVQPTIDESLFKRNKVTTLAADVGR